MLRLFLDLIRVVSFPLFILGIWNLFIFFALSLLVRHEKYKLKLYGYLLYTAIYSCLQFKRSKYFCTHPPSSIPSPPWPVEALRLFPLVGSCACAIRPLEKVTCLWTELPQPAKISQGENHTWTLVQAQQFKANSTTVKTNLMDQLSCWPPNSPKL